MLDTWRRFGWDLESDVVEDVIVPVGITLVGDVDITLVASDTLVCTPDDDVVVGDTNDDLASALALTLSASELSENSWNNRNQFQAEFPKQPRELTLSWSLLLAVVDTERGNDVLIVVTGWDTIELNSVDVVWKRVGNDRKIGFWSCHGTYMSGADVWLWLLSISIGF